MRLNTIILLCLLTVSISTGSPTLDQAMAGSIDLAKAAQYFREFERLCTEDGGRLWGVSLCGPVLLVDPGTRMAVGNRADSGGVLESRAGVFVGELPARLGIANTATDWNGTRWTMLIWWSLSKDRTRRMRLMAHESFHRIQPDLGLDTHGEVNAHLDTAGGRFWMQMEWKALEKALLSEGDARRKAVVDALTFRTVRHEEFPKAAGREIPLEIFEGLAEYTGMRLAGFPNEQVVSSMMAKIEEETGFVRSFAYVSGPLYGFLLDGSGTEWRKAIDRETDLGAVLAAGLKVHAGPVENATDRAERYGGADLRLKEETRERERIARLSKWRALLVDGPVLVVDLNVVSSGSFDPRKVFPFGDRQVVYTDRELIAEWGALTVEDGVILEDENIGRAYVSISGAATDFSEGEGWTLELKEGWKVVPGDRPGDVSIRRE
jgi:hypothetical protein